MDRIGMKQAACTIVSFNYLPYARALCESFLATHPGRSFHVLLVDRMPAGYDSSQEPFELLPVEQLEIPDFLSTAFKYDILELNTNVKPSFLRHLLNRGIEHLLYLDPDIFVYKELTPVFEALSHSAIVLTPHMLSPANDDVRQEVILLSAGVFNLGFIAVKQCTETDRFLLWWEQRCLHDAFDEQRAGMFVDQKWINFVPCFFDSVHILKHPGCNMAYWNLHERKLSGDDGSWTVNEDAPLLFFHFSGISVDGGERISKFTNRYTLSNRADLRLIFEEYRAALVRHGIRDASGNRYAFGSFDNGQPIHRLCRSIYAANLDRFGGEDPFRSHGRFYPWASRKGLLGSGNAAKHPTPATYSKDHVGVRAIHGALRMALRILGADRYMMLMKYLSHISILRNQKDVFRAN